VAAISGVSYRRSGSGSGIIGSAASAHGAWRGSESNGVALREMP